VLTLPEMLVVISEAGWRRKAITWVIEERNCSQRRACQVAGMATKTYHYVSRCPDDAEASVRLRALANERRGSVIITSWLSIDLLSPLEIGKRLDAASLGDEVVPCLAAGIDGGTRATEQSA